MGKNNKNAKKAKTSNTNANKYEKRNQNLSSTQKKKMISKSDTTTAVTSKINIKDRSASTSNSTGRENENSNSETCKDSKPENPRPAKSNNWIDEMDGSITDQELANWDENSELDQEVTSEVDDNTEKNIRKYNNRQDSNTEKQNHQGWSSKNKKQMEKNRADKKGSSCYDSSINIQRNSDKADSKYDNHNPRKCASRRGDQMEKCQQDTSTKYHPIFNRGQFDNFFEKIKRDTNMDFKVVNEIFGDLFTADDDYSLGHCVAEDMSMGSGIAVSFRREFKRVDELLNQRKTQGKVAILQDKQRYIYYLVTKRKSSGKPTYFTLWSALHEMRNHIISQQVQKLALPRIGCGLDGLEWSCVKKMLESIFRDLNIEIVIYNFQQNYGQTKQKLQTKALPKEESAKNRSRRKK